MRKKLYLLLTLENGCLIKKDSNIWKIIANLVVFISIQQMNKGNIVSFLNLHRENLVYIWIFLISNVESIDISIYRKRGWKAPFLFILNIDNYQLFKESIWPIKYFILFWTQHYFLLSNSIKLRNHQYLFTIITYHISISNFNNLFEIFNIILAKRFQTTIASKSISRVISSKLELLSSQLAIELIGRRLFTTFYRELRAYVRQKINMYVSPLFFEVITEQLGNLVILLELEHQSRVIDDITCAVYVVLLPLFVFHYF